MKGELKFTADGTSLSCEAKLSHVGIMDKIHIVAVMFNALDIQSADEAATIVAAAITANEMGMFDREQTKIVIPIPKHKSDEDEG